MIDIHYLFFTLSSPRKIAINLDIFEESEGLSIDTNCKAAQISIAEGDKQDESKLPSNTPI